MFASHTRLSWLFQIQFDSSGRHAACLQVESKFGFYVASHLLLNSDGVAHLLSRLCCEIVQRRHMLFCLAALSTFPASEPLNL